MSVAKAAMSGVIGFALGAGAMLMPSNQKLKKQMIRKMDSLMKMARTW